MAYLVKDPGAVRIEYTFDWDDDGELAVGEPITASVWAVYPSGELTVIGSDLDDETKKTWVELSGGEVGKQYEVVNTITTLEGRTLRRAMVLLVERRSA